MAKSQHGLAGGMSWAVLKGALIAAMTTFQAETGGPGRCVYWSGGIRGEHKGDAATAARAQLLEILSLLWPSHVFPLPGDLEEDFLDAMDPYRCPGVVSKGECERQSKRT